MSEDLISELPSAQPEQHGRVFKGIVVEYPTYSTNPEYEGKPYFSIKYTENGQGFIGYGTFKPEVLSEYLKEYFMPAIQPEREKGKWEVYNILDYAQRPTGRKVGRCFCCGHLTDEFRKIVEASKKLTNFCPDCGADLRKGKEDEET